MADVFSFHHINDEFGNIGRMIPDPFDRLGRTQQIDARFHGIRFAPHIFDKPANDIVELRIHRIVSSSAVTVSILA